MRESNHISLSSQKMEAPTGVIRLISPLPTQTLRNPRVSLVTDRVGAGQDVEQVPLKGFYEGETECMAPNFWLGKDLIGQFDSFNENPVHKIVADFAYLRGVFSVRFRIRAFNRTITRIRTQSKARPDLRGPSGWLDMDRYCGTPITFVRYLTFPQKSYCLVDNLVCAYPIGGNPNSTIVED